LIKKKTKESEVIDFEARKSLMKIEDLERELKQKNRENILLKSELESVLNTITDYSIPEQDEAISNLIGKKHIALADILKKIKEIDANYAYPIAELPIGTRARNALLRHGIDIVGEFYLIPHEEIYRINNIGGKSIELIRDALKKIEIDYVFLMESDEAVGLLRKYSATKKEMELLENKLSRMQSVKRMEAV